MVLKLSDFLFLFITKCHYHQQERDRERDEVVVGLESSYPIK